ncbi:radical SAM protein [Thermococcus piezophilus]|uniref:radical SAM protein n=1 Tax=Thermococcus piezophilus TaxID=1712654 RepID=UPI0019012557|nr:radical SAM protein [Thermococcus piezophilus]
MNALNKAGISRKELDSFLDSIKAALGEYGKYQVNINLKMLKAQTKEYPKIGNPNIYHKGMSPLSAPIRLIWEITKKCNFSCNFCYAHGDKHIGNEMTFEEIKDVINQASDLGVFYFVLLGGEPLTRKDLYNIIGTIRDHGLYATVITNRYLVHRQLNALKLLPPMPIAVSLHGNAVDYAKIFKCPSRCCCKHIQEEYT